MNTKKKWFKSAFIEPKSPAYATQKRQKMQDVFLDEDDSINLSELDLSNICNNNQTNLEPQKMTSEMGVTNTDFKSSNWIETFAPQNKDDLAVHGKKLGEIVDWFIAIKKKEFKNIAPILVVTGPSGSGKSAAIKILAKDFEYSISEWITPVDVDHTFNDKNCLDKATYTESQFDKFAQFLFQSSRYRSVFDTSSKRLVLVEDLPNVFIKDSKLFEEILERYTNYGKAPLIFIVTDTKSRTLNVSFNLFTDEVRNRFNITSISFNSVSDTLLKKGLKRLCDIMAQPGFETHYIIPNKETIDSIILSSQGDIRNAVINLHFASQKNSIKLPIQIFNETSSLSRQKKSKNQKRSKLKSLGTDENITVLHALGRVFNPKYQEDPNTKGLKTFTNSPDEISSLLTTQPMTSLSLIHHNYIGHFQSLEDIVDATDYLSHADVIFKEWRSGLSTDIGMNLAVRGIMTCNDHPVTGRWMPIKSAKNQAITYQVYEKERNDMETSVLVSSNNFACDYRTYTKIIPKISKIVALENDDIFE